MATLFDLPPDERFIDPIFATYCDDIAWGLTQFLYGDQYANPYWQEPEKWDGLAFGKAFWRVIQSDSITTAGGTFTTPINLGGGLNAVVLAFNATVLRTLGAVAPATTSLYNERAAYVTYQQERNDGTEEIPPTPLNNLVGSGEWPADLVFPWCWYGPTQRTLTLVNNALVDVTVDMAWHIVMLETGR